MKVAEIRRSPFLCRLGGGGGVILVLGALALPFAAHAEPTPVSSAAELQAALAAGSGDIRLTADIDGSQLTTATSFSGTIDGGGFALTGLTAPLIDAVNGDFALMNLTVSGANVALSGSAAPIGLVACTVSSANLRVEGLEIADSTLAYKTTASGSRLGLLFGKVLVTGSAMISDCHTRASCGFKTPGNSKAGGLIGTAEITGAGATLTISNCVNAAAIVQDSHSVGFGGFLGYASVKGEGGTVSAETSAFLALVDCTNHAGRVSNSANPSFGGIADNVACGNSGHAGVVSVIRCLNDGNAAISGSITSGVEYGGVLGAFSAGQLTMEGCWNKGDISVSADESRACPGGMVGSIAAPIKKTVTIRNCANTGNLQGYYAGGMIGSMAHNASYSANKWIVESCLNAGTVTVRCETAAPGQAIGRLSSGVAYPNVSIRGNLFQTDALIGGRTEGASIKTYVANDNIFANASNGLVDGFALTALNDYNACNLWKQGSKTPILKFMPDEPAPDSVSVVFKDAEAFGSTELLRVTIERGGYVLPPADPEHEGVTFKGWGRDDFTGFMEDTVLVAQYYDGIVSYAVRFLDYDGTVLSEQPVEHGVAAVAPADPSREGYLFIGWDAEFSEVLSDLTVTAQYVPKEREFATAAALAEVLSGAQYRDAVYRLTADVELPEDWKSLPLVGTFDGNGKTIRFLSDKPFFSEITGEARDFVLDGATDGTAHEMTPANKVTFGVVAETLSGGCVRNVTIRNITVQGKDDSCLGFVVGEMRDGAVMDGCTVEATCALKQRKSTVGGLAGRVTRTEAFAPADEAGEPVRGRTLAAVSSCTNHAEITTFAGGAAIVGGLVGSVNVFNSIYRFDIVISNCVNRGGIVSTFNANNVHAGGFVGQRSSNNSGYGGVLRLIDCANLGDVMTQGDGGNIGGFVGDFYRGCATFAKRCVNRGRLGGDPVAFDLSDGASVTNRVGGFWGSLELYGQNPVQAEDCANYGTVTAIAVAGGFVGAASPNEGHPETCCSFTNCANHADVAIRRETGSKGQIFGAFLSKPAASATRVYGAYNCFFPNADYVGYDKGAQIRTDGNVTAADEGYAAGTARRALTAVAESLGLEPWTLGKIDGKPVPELGCFCLKPYTGFKLILR